MVQIPRARGASKWKCLITRSGAGLATLGEQFGGKTLRFGDALDFDRDGIDRLLQLFELQILRASSLELSWLPLNASNETDYDGAERAS
jgi:hypothetical protein